MIQSLFPPLFSVSQPQGPLIPGQETPPSIAAHQILPSSMSAPFISDTDIIFPQVSYVLPPHSARTAALRELVNRISIPPLLSEGGDHVQDITGHGPDRCYEFQNDLLHERLNERESAVTRAEPTPGHTKPEYQPRNSSSKQTAGLGCRRIWGNFLSLRKRGHYESRTPVCRLGNPVCVLSSCAELLCDMDMPVHSGGLSFTM